MRVVWPEARRSERGAKEESASSDSDSVLLLNFDVRVSYGCVITILFDFVKRLSGTFSIHCLMYQKMRKEDSRVCVKKKKGAHSRM